MMTKEMTVEIIPAYSLDNAALSRLTVETLHTAHVKSECPQCRFQTDHVGQTQADHFYLVCLACGQASRLRTIFK